MFSLIKRGGAVTAIVQWSTFPQSQSLTAARRRVTVESSDNRRQSEIEMTARARDTATTTQPHHVGTLQFAPPFHTLSHVSCWSSRSLYCHATVSIEPFVILILQLLQAGSGCATFANFGLGPSQLLYLPWASRYS